MDDGAAGVALVAEIGEGALDAVDRLLDRHFRQADEDRLGQSRRDVNLRLDGNGVDTNERVRVQLREHGEHPRGRRPGFATDSFPCLYRLRRCSATVRPRSGANPYLRLVLLPSPPLRGRGLGVRGL